MVNIKDIAKLAKVSIATVSHVINKNYFVSDALKKRVENAIMELNYHPNLIAGSLRKKRTGTIGLVVPDISNLFFAILAKQIEDITYLNEYNIIICNSSYSVEREINNLDTLCSKRVDGIIIIPETDNKSIIENIKESGMPIVLIERKIQGLHTDIVLVDHFKAGYDATKYLLNLGHRQIAYIDRISDKYHSLDKREGYMKALKEHGLEVNNDIIIRGNFTYEDGFAVTQNLLKQKPRITALLAYSDYEALGAISAINKAGLKTPEDISVIGYGDLPFSRYVIPELTTVRTPIPKIAEEAVKLLKLRMRKLNVKKVLIKDISPELIIRKSTSVAPK